MAFLRKYSGVKGALGHLAQQDNVAAKILIVVVAVAVVALMFPRGEAIEYEYNVGGIWVENDLIAPFSFPIYRDEDQYERETRAAVAGVFPVFEVRAGAVETQRESLFTVLRRQRASSEYGILWSRRATLEQVMDEVLRVGIVDQPSVRRDHPSLAVRKGSEENIVSSRNLYDVPGALTTVQERLSAMFGEVAVQTRAMDVLRAVIQPTLVYSKSETEKLINVAVESVPRTVGYVQENERIVGKHERITQEVKLKLDSLRRARAERGAEHSHTWQYFGVVLHVGLVTMLYGIYLYLFRKRIFHDNRKLALIAIILVIESFFAYLSLAIEVRAPIQYLIFVPAASMLMTIIFDSRVAFYGTVTLAFLIAGIRGNDYSVALASLVAGALSVYTVRDIKNRTQIFRSLAFIFVGYACIILALGLERFAAISTLFGELTFALANAVFSPVLTYGLLIFFERVFKVTTDLTLLEMSDFNSPLLRRLSEKAPGTFHHSITLGNLAEAAAEATGANSILARVGAYYHDIGKIAKPEYFAENQPQGKNRHTRLRPRMSALIIAAHVKEGVEMGRQQGIPDVVLEFIPQHHGTTLMSFFYDKALRQAELKPNPKDVVREQDYRYPGPKPQTKETGIVMLADAIEATARAMDDPTPQKLEAMIDSTIKNRFAEGELDECELTLRDLTKIKEAFVKTLVGIHHSRVKYPEPEKETKGETIRPPAVDHHQQALRESTGGTEAQRQTEHQQQPLAPSPAGSDKAAAVGRQSPAKSAAIGQDQAKPVA